MTPDMPAPGWAARFKIARIGQLEDAISAATGKPRQPLDGADRLSLRALAVLLEAFKTALAAAGDPLGTLAARIEGADMLLSRAGDNHRPDTAALVENLRTLRGDVAVLLAVLDRLLADHGAGQ